MQSILLEVFADAEVIRKIAVVNERFMHADKRMRAAWMPDSALGRISLVRNPSVRLHVAKLVVFNRLFGKTNELEYQQVFRMAHHERAFFAKRRVIGFVDAVCILEDEFVFHFIFRHAAQFLLFGEQLKLF